MWKPKRACSYPGCPNLVNGRYCEEHKRQTDNEYNRYKRDEQSKKFYSSPAWRRLSKSQLEKEPLCTGCLDKGILTKAAIADHIVPIKQGGAKLDSSNLQSLCQSCHSIKSAKEGSRWGKVQNP